MRPGQIKPNDFELAILERQLKEVKDRVAHGLESPNATYPIEL